METDNTQKYELSAEQFAHLNQVKPKFILHGTYKIVDGLADTKKRTTIFLLIVNYYKKVFLILWTKYIKAKNIPI